ncbi:TSUP family transporter, partial [Escherichia coli]
IGTYDGLVGPGTGTFLILAYVMLMGEDALHASGTAKLVNLGSNVGALITLITTGHVLYALALPAAAFGIAGNMVGARLAIKKGAPFVRALL